MLWTLLKYLYFDENYTCQSSSVPKTASKEPLHTAQNVEQPNPNRKNAVIL